MTGIASVLREKVTVIGVDDILIGQRNEQGYILVMTEENTIMIITYGSCSVRTVSSGLCISTYMTNMGLYSKKKVRFEWIENTDKDHNKHL